MIFLSRPAPIIPYGLRPLGQALTIMSDSEYNNYAEWKNWQLEKFAQPSLRECVYFKSEMLRAGVGELKDKKILELGFGNGGFTGYAESEGANYSGTELIPQLLARASDAGFQVHDAKIPLVDVFETTSLDVVVAFDVFEHIDIGELRDTLASIYSLLSKGGVVIARVPSGDSPFSGPIQHGDYTHKGAMGSIMMENLAREAGFEKVSIKEQALPIWGISIRTALYRIFLRLLRFVVYPPLRMLMGGGRPILTPNMVVILRKSN